jgi:predicted metalloprotease
MFRPAFALIAALSAMSSIVHLPVAAAQAPSPLFLSQAAANPEYQGDVLTTIKLLNDFWSMNFPTVFHARFQPIRGLRAYAPQIGIEGIPCGNERLPEMNAVYCNVNDLIQWDESLLLGFYDKIGDFAAAFAIAHEWGHAVQARLGIRSGIARSRELELQADCFAGAWARYVEQLGLLEGGDIDEATEGLFLARDRIGTSWLDPQAHGSGRDRIVAFSQGQEEGIQRCFGNAPRPVAER